MITSPMKRFFLAVLVVLLWHGLGFSDPVVKVHPIEFTTPPNCSECHDDERKFLDHASDFSRRHKYYASQKSQLCNACHKETFCSDCHANKEEIKPSDKYKGSPERFLPHRGDYLTQHKIDGRVNPVPCMKCHGRNNNARCKTCHR